MEDVVNWSDIVGNKTLKDGGYIGDIMELGLLHIKQEMDSDRLVQEQSGQVYVSLLEAAITQGIKFELDKASIEDKIELERNKMEAELEKHWGYIVTRDTDGSLILGNSTDAGKIDEEVDLLQTQDSELLLNGTKDRLLKTEQIVKVQEEIDLLQSQDLEVLAGTDRNDSKQADNELTSEKNRLVLVAQEALLIRQKAGFDDNKFHKILSSSLQYHGIVSELLTDGPHPTATRSDAGLDLLYEDAQASY